ncbi:ACP S-malonyltransferase [Faecalibacillus faecis]|jgi:[acyl-carrier-protein] S-malonyltransferase|uniref:ACP S-malonyltransferase n=1 Tax=Faecalibacillus faecis TaxID=1982628 RepID=UPI0030497CC0|nr:ACP S-malonyltransferase [Christensenellaceae bacterium]
MKKFAVLFPGQGAQYVGMGKELLNSELSNNISQIAFDILKFDFKEMFLKSNPNDLLDTSVAQPLLLIYGYLAFRECLSKGDISPQFLMGHSLGEITALTCAEAISITDALKIVNYRGKLMKEFSNKIGSMIAIIGIQQKEAEQLCADINSESNFVQVANINSLDQIVVSGNYSGLEVLKAYLDKMPVKIMELPMNIPFHSKLMEPIKKPFKKFLSGFEYRPLKYSVISNVHACPYLSEKHIVDNLTEQLSQPVMWQDSLTFIDSEKVDFCIDIGPKTILKNLSYTNSIKAKVYAYDNTAEKVKIGNLLMGLNEDETQKRLNFIKACLTLAISVKNRNFMENEYLQGVIEPYRNIERMLKDIEIRKLIPTTTQLTDAYNMVEKVFITKKMSDNEILEKTNFLFNKTGINMKAGINQ